MINKKSTNYDMILPGDHVAFIEEFESGKNTFVLDGSIRSLSLGIKEYDFKKRQVTIERKKKANFPQIGDVIVGYIEMLFGSMISIRILYLNNKKFDSGLSAIASTRITSESGGWNHRKERGERRIKFVYRVGDIVRGRIYSLLNSSAHATISDKDLGVIYCICYICGGDTVKLNNTIKCIECGMMEEKKLASDFGKEILLTLEKQRS
jgi:exosome complex component CSL4